MKTFSRFLLLALLLPAAALTQAQPEAFVEGSHYEELGQPVRTANPDKIEVVEVFWYGCPHCYAFEPLLESWTAKLPDDVDFRRSPGMWNPLMETHAAIYYTAESLGVLDEIHAAAFTSIHQQREYLQTEEAVKELFVQHGVDPEEFDKTWNSFSVASSVKKAGANMSDYGVTGVPSLIVNGKYRVSSGGPVRSQEDMLRVAEFLIRKERG